MLRDKASGTLTLTVSEIYETVQGEGILAGTPSLFIRFQGCNLRCPWCDQPESLGEGGRKVSLEEIAKIATASKVRHAVITGGEPFAHGELPYLVRDLLSRGFSVQIETNGTLWIPEMDNLADRIHITCSPKGVARYYTNPRILRHAAELKFVVDDEIEPEVLLREEFRKHLEKGLVVLQPESNRAEMFDKAFDIQRRILEKGFTVRVLPQIHKLIGLR